MREITEMSALELGRAIKSGELDSPRVVSAFFDRIEQKNGKYNAFITASREEALKSARTVQEKIKSGEAPSPLAGVPIAIKDNLCTAGVKTTCASRMLKDFIPPYDATAVKRLKEAGMVVLGKTNMDEFAMGTTNETSYFGPVYNPWDTERSPGGSSGGSAAAVCAHMAPCALGTDTGGSIRQPASYCGLFGMKPTYGAVSRYGLISHGSSLEQIGPLAKTAEDCAAILHILSGRDELDATSSDYAWNFQEEMEPFDIRGLKIGVVANTPVTEDEHKMSEKVAAAAKVFQRLGCSVAHFPLKALHYAAAVYIIISSAEASSNLGRFDGVRCGTRAENYEDLFSLYENTRAEGFGEEVRRRIMLGTFVLSSENYDRYYRSALKARALIRNEFQKAFGRFDLILCAGASKTAPKLGEEMHDSVKRYKGDVNTVCANLVGLPALVMPCGLDLDGLPVGVQLIGRKYEDSLVLKAAHTFQKSTQPAGEVLI